ncbi:MAG: hypothetical protein KDD34_05625 [Bdellovibrionales bacterium]|nr:hypothetical protein [Bdellovibrionales bacterium]
MSDDKLIENAKAEREFLHDIATPIMIVSGHLEYLLKNGFEQDPQKAKERIEKAHANIAKLSDKLVARRKVLHEISGVNK